MRKELTVISAVYANPEHTAAIVVSSEAGEVAVSQVDHPDLWDAVLAFSPTDYIPDRTPDINAHALAMKIGIVNATKTDGGPDFPVSDEALALIRERYSDFIAEASAKSLLGEVVTDEEKATIALIKSGFAAFAAINTTADTIIAAGDVSDPVASDPRWPVFA